MAEETLEFTLEVNGVTQAINNIEDLEQAVVQLQQQINSGNYGADKIEQLNQNLQTAETRLAKMKQSMLETRDASQTTGVDGAAAIGLFRESFDGAANAAEVLAGENETLGRVVSTVMKGISAVNSAREISENRVTIAVIKRSVAEKAAAAGTVILNTVNRALNTTLSLNPIGVLVTTVVLLTTGILALIRPIQKAIEQFDFLNVAINKIIDASRNVLNVLSGGLIDDAATAKTKSNAQEVLKSFDQVDSAANQLINTIQNRIKILQAEGATEKEIYDAKISLLNAELEKRKSAISAIIALGQDATDEQLQQLASLRKEVVDFGVDLEVEAINFRNSQKQARERDLQEQKRAAEAAQSARKAAAERIAQAEQAAQARLLNIQQSNLLASIQNEEERARLSLELTRQRNLDEIQELEKTGVKIETLNSLRLETEKNYQQELDKIEQQSRDKRLAQEAAYLERLNSLQQEYTLLNLTDEQQRVTQELEFAREADLLAIEQLELSLEQKNSLKLQYELNYQEKLAEIQESFELSQREREYEQFMQSIELTNEFNQMSLSQQQEFLEMRNQQFLKYLENEKLTSDERKKIEQDYADYQSGVESNIAQNRANALDAVQAAIANISSVIGEETSAGKALAAADAVINTYKGASQALGSAPPPFNFALAGSVVAAGLVNVRKILSTQVPKSTSSSSQSINPSKFARGGLLSGPTHAQGGIPTPFGELEGGEFVINRQSTQMYTGILSAINQIGGGRKFADGGMVGMETLNQLNDLESRLANPVPIKTYVLATDVSNAQEADFRINNLSRL